MSMIVRRTCLPQSLFLQADIADLTKRQESPEYMVLI
jgi:hypothetical protein